MDETNKKELNTIYIAGLLHDIGKYIHKYSGRVLKHNIESQLFILDNPKICLDYDAYKIANIVVNHHYIENDFDFNRALGVKISPNSKVDKDLLNIAIHNLTDNSYKNEIVILKSADSMSASSDRASEIESGVKGTSENVAPLISPLTKIFNNEIRIAIRHGMKYEAYEYTGENELPKTVSEQDPDFQFKIEQSFKHFMEQIPKVKSINDLDEMLKEHWSTANANTWRSQGENLGNTTTSLYDHSKTTAAIAACIYINQMNKYVDTDIDVIHITYNGIGRDIRDIIDDIFDEYGLCNPNIITSTDSEAYVMIPSSIKKSFAERLNLENENSYIEYGETIDYEIATRWQFKNCRKTFIERTTEKHIGILSVISRITPRVDDEIRTYQDKQFNNKYIAGFSLNNYKYVIDNIIRENDSISKVSTTFRIFEMFNNDVQKYLLKNDCNIIISNLSTVIYSTDSDKIHQIENDIDHIYNKYVCGVLGLSFTCMQYNRYADTIEIIKRQLQDRQNCLDLSKGKDTTIVIHNKRYKISALYKYRQYVEKLRDIEKSLIQRTKELYEDCIQYNDDKNSIHLMSLSRMNYMLRQIDEEHEEFKQLAISNMYDAKNDKVPSNAFIFYEALITALKEKRTI